MSFKSVSFIPYELWTRWKPSFAHLRPLGIVAYVHNPSNKFGKLGPRGQTCIFIRYHECSKVYVFIGEHGYEGNYEFE